MVWALLSIPYVGMEMAHQAHSQMFLSFSHPALPVETQWESKTSKPAEKALALLVGISEKATAFLLKLRDPHLGEN